jgi:hypothetical protein
MDMAPNALSLDVNEFDARTRTRLPLYYLRRAPLTRHSPQTRTNACLLSCIIINCSLSLAPWRRNRRLAAKASLAAGGSGPSRRGWRRPWSASTPASASRSTAPPRHSLTWTPRSCSPCGGLRTTLPSTSACRCWTAPATSSPAMVVTESCTRTPSHRPRCHQCSTRRSARLPTSRGQRRFWRRGGWSSGTCASSCRCSGRLGPSRRGPAGSWPRRRRPRRGGPRPGCRPSTGATATPTPPCATPSSTARNRSRRIVLSAEPLKKLVPGTCKNRALDQNFGFGYMCMQYSVTLMNYAQGRSLDPVRRFSYYYYYRAIEGIVFI